MTRDEILAEADPQFLKGRRRERRWIGGLGALAILALIAAAVSFVLTIKTETRVTKIEKSACAKNTTNPSPECEEIRQEIARHEGIVGPCILHQRVTGERGRNCPRFFVPHGRELQIHPNLSKDLDSGGGVSGATGTGGAPASDQPGTTQPSTPHHLTTHPVHQSENSGSEGGGGTVDEGGSESASPPEGEASTRPGEISGPGASTQPESVLESTGAHVGEVLNGAGELVETTTCGLTAPLVCIKR